MRMMFAARAMDNMAGGVERMIITIMNEMVRRGHEVALFSWDHAEAEAFYPLDSKVKWYKLDLGRPATRAGLGLRLQRAPKVRRMVNDFAPDVIVGFQGGAYRALRLYTLGLGIPVAVAERNAPTLYDYVDSRRKQRIERFTYRFAKRITVQFDRFRTYYPPYLQDKIVETPNPVSAAKLMAAPDQPSADGRYRLLSVGRLSYQKNYPALIDAFGQLAAEFPQWDLHIVGEGKDRARLEAQIASMPDLMGRVFLPGTRKDVEREYEAAQLFCLPSRWEGFPNALAEALAHGLPSVGFEGCAGVADLIENRQTGLLAAGNEDKQTLSEALRRLMDAHHQRAQMGRAATTSMRKYRADLCFDRWEDVLLEAGEATPKAR